MEKYSSKGCLRNGWKWKILKLGMFIHTGEVLRQILIVFGRGIALFRQITPTRLREASETGFRSFYFRDSVHPSAVAFPSSLVGVFCYTSRKHRTRLRRSIALKVSPNTFTKIKRKKLYPMLNDMLWHTTWTYQQRHQYHVHWWNFGEFFKAGPYKCFLSTNHPDFWWFRLQIYAFF